MGRFRAALVAVSAIALAGSAAGRASAGGPVDAKQLQRLGEAARANDCKAAIKIGGPILDKRDTGDLDPKMLAAVYDLVTLCEIELGKSDAALAHALAGTKLQESSDALWRMRFALAADAKRYDVAVATLEDMTQGRGGALNGLETSWLSQLNVQLMHDDQTDLRRRLLIVLTAPSYQPDEPGASLDYYRLQYATLLVGSGDLTGAKAQLAQIDQPGVLIDASFDPRIGPLMPADTDYRAAAEKMLARAEADAVTYPRSLNAVNDGAAFLRMLGRPADALAMLKTVEPRIGDPAQWDKPDRIMWWWDSLARTYEALGRYDEAVAAFRKGAAQSEHGGVNISQTINLAYLQVRFGHPADAIATLAVLDAPGASISPYGVMQWRTARGCARALAHDAAGAQADLDYVIAHDKDAPGSLATLAQCRGDQDRAAASYIRRLGDPDQRSDARRALSDFNPPLPGVPESPFDAGLAAIRARPDVQAAIKAAGGTRRIPLARAEF